MQFIMNAKKAGFGLIVLIGVGFAFWPIINRHIDTDQVHKENASYEHKAIVPSKATDSIKSSTDLNIENKGSVESKNALSPAERAEKDQWLFEHGHTSVKSGVGSAEYSNYDMVTLKKLADGGDAKAVDALAALEWKQKGDYQAAVSIYMDAAAKGSTAALGAAGRVIESALYESASTPEEKHNISLEVLSFVEAANLRGDRLPKIQNKIAFVDFYNITLSENDHLKISARAKEIYDQLHDRRRELNLGDFDDSVPDSLNKYFDRMEAAKSY